MSRKRKYSDEFRLQVIGDVLDGRFGGCKRVAHKYNLHYSIVERWVALYKMHGINGISNPKGSYDGEFKVHVVEYMHSNSLSLRETASHFCIPSAPTISKWERIYYEEGPDALLEERRGRNNMKKKTPKKPKKNVNENEDLFAEVQRLRMENEYLKKLNALVLEREKSEQKKK